VTYLLDVSGLLARLWRTHVFHERVKAWADVEKVAVCPITELGFVRISTQPAFGATVTDARKMLASYYKAFPPAFLPCDLKLLDSFAPAAGTQTTDFYLASLAQKHGMKWATLEDKPKHSAAFVIPPSTT
jgi:predicted nucleic acid-binding protein